MTTWSVQDAKARFSEFLETCLREGPQVVSKRGEETAVLVSMDEWKRLNQDKKPSLRDLLLSDEARTENLVPPRRIGRRREPINFD